MVQARDIAIVGTGTAGSASALFLARQGHRVTLYERVLDPQPVGAGIMMQPSGLSVLAQLGLRSAVVERGEPLTQLVAQTPSGHEVLNLAYADVAPSLSAVGLHRGVLFDVLFRSAQREPNVSVRLGVSVAQVNSDARGTWLLDEAGVRHGPHELVVVCAGARAQLTGAELIPADVRRYPWGALWAVVPDPSHHFTGRLFQVVRGTRVLLGLLPTGLGVHGTTPHVSLFVSTRVDGVTGFRERDFAEWKRTVLGDMPAAAPVLEQLHSHRDVLFAEYHDVVRWPWNEGRVVYLGDAAHAMSPQLGQGANLALVDAATLADCFVDAESIEDALFAYSRRRRAQLDWYQFITRWLTPFFQSDVTALGWVRDVALGAACRVPAFRREMVWVMAGLSRGPFLHQPLPSGSLS